MRVGASGPQAPDVAWERYARPALWSTWAPQIRAVECDAPRLVAGARGSVVAAVPSPVAVRLPFTVTDVDEPGRTWSWTVGPRVLPLHLQHGVEPAEGGGSSTWLVLHGPWPVIAAYAPLARLALRRLVR
ncbi:SRPBCC family protein [Vallicoccus soli]|uniref:SRPBCC family protein n=1 Tax=Vallicoccus soli TaxID=2339232 RepID=A0A3A3YVI0_9ACTN|nr:SRPBCC family protein [Vallicoccus soli]